MFGESTNNIFQEYEVAKPGIFSFSNTPLKLLTAAGIVLLGLSFVLSVIVTALRLWVPDIAPRGVTTLLLASLFFGAINLFAIGLVGEYIAKIMEEVKARPRLISSRIDPQRRDQPVVAGFVDVALSFFGTSGARQSIDEARR